MTDQQDDIEDDVDAPKCKACGVPWTRHQGIIAICQQYLNTVETLERVTKERDAALAVVNEFIIDTTTNNETPIHECAFRYDPEKGKCDKCEAWGNYVGLFCSNEDEEETQ